MKELTYPVLHSDGNRFDLSNQAIRSHSPLRPNKLNKRADAVVSAESPTLYPILVPLFLDSLLLWNNAQLLAYVKVFVDDLLRLAQGPTNQRRHVRRTLFHALDKVFRPLEKMDPPHRKEVFLLKKLYAGDCSWSTCQVLLGWLVDTFNMTLCLPNHRTSRLKEIISATPPPTSGGSASNTGTRFLGRSIPWRFPSLVLGVCLATCRKPCAM